MLRAHTVFPPSEGGKAVQRDVQPRPVFNQDEIGHRFKLGVLQQTLAIKVDVLKQEHSEFAIDGKRVVLLTIFRDVSKPVASIERCSPTTPLMTDRLRSACDTSASITVTMSPSTTVVWRFPKPRASKTWLVSRSCDNGFVLPQLSQHQVNSVAPSSVVSTVRKVPLPSSHDESVVPTRSCQPWPVNERSNACSPASVV